MKFSRFLFIVLLINISSGSYAQNANSLDTKTIMEKAVAFADSYPIEKVYLHFDNNSYYLGETLWYKAYVVTGGTRRATISKVLHVELWNQYGQKADEQLLKIEEGIACGQFNLKKRMLPGYYEVRAYTSWMRNWGDLNYFSRVFPFYAAPAVGGEYKKELINFRLDLSMKERPQVKYKSVDISFFPEGGNLVQGVWSKVAFRVRAEKEPFPDIKLKVYSANDKLIDTCSVMHDGMGWFRYCPSKKNGYVRFMYKGKNYKFDLPNCAEKGVCMSLTPAVNDTLAVSLHRDSEARVDTFTVGIIAGCRPYQALNVITNDKKVNLEFPLADIPGGVAQLILMTSYGKILCERMFFVNRPSRYVNISVDNDFDILKPCEKVDFKLRVTGGDDRPVPTNLSVSVRSILNSDVQCEYDNARTNLLLSSEVRGYVHRPEYYFLPDGNVRTQELDLLLAVQGWKKYNWENLSFPSIPAYLPETSLQLSGRLKTMWTGRYLSDAEVSIMIRDSLVAMGSIRTDSLGYFVFPLPELQGRKEVILQSRVGKKKNRKRCYFLLDRHFAPPLRAYEPEELLHLWDSLPNLDHLFRLDDRALQLKDGDGIWLDEVLIKSKKRLLPPVEYDRSIAAVFDVERLVENDLDQGKRYISLFDFLRNRLSSFKIDKQGSYWYNGKGILPIVNGRVILNPVFTHQLFSEVEGIRSVAFCIGSVADKYLSNALSEREATDVDGVDWNMQMKEMEQVVDGVVDEKSGRRKFLATEDKSDYVTLGYLGNNGVVMIVDTKPGVDYHLKHKAARGLRPTYVLGYTQPEAFYSPDYSKDDLSISVDHRRTLYWNPNVCTNEDGEAEIVFYNNQEHTILNINVETVTIDGRIGAFNQ